MSEKNNFFFDDMFVTVYCVSGVFRKGRAGNHNFTFEMKWRSF